MNPAKETSRKFQPDLVRSASSTALQLVLEYHDFPESLNELYLWEFVSSVQGVWMMGNLSGAGYGG